MEEVLYSKFLPQNSFFALSDCDSKFLPKPFFFFFFSFKHNWPTPSATPHHKWASQWFEISDQRQPIRSNPLYFQNHAKSLPNSSLNKSNTSQNTKIILYGIKASSTTQKPVKSNTPTLYKTLSSAYKGRGMFYLET